ncbi:MAG: flagellar hook-associated protein FlgK [Gammaproteobacteria bacterium]|nr:flagellar hook-associated protein FlgK [Gammaproteobacteria bacterium]MDH5652956.1 flagellar hook-associated protein FlgK [Gammaproteobacteria bacterium]
MSTGDMLGISVSGVMAAQRALSTTGHNIANANSEGYSRQRITMEARPPSAVGRGGIGNGVVVNDVHRIYDDFVTGQVRSITALSKSMDINHDYTVQVDNMLADPKAGLAPAMQEFFSAVNGVANNPSSTSSRQVMLGSARSLTDRFAYLDERFEVIRSAANKNMKTVAVEINEVAYSIAETNKRIITASEVGGDPPNDLLDQRDHLLQQLSELIGVRVSYQSDGTMNVYIGNGQLLVVGQRASEIKVESTPADPQQMDIIFQGPDSSAYVTRFVTGGRLGGMLDFQRTILDRAQNELGRIAIGISKAFNDQHKLGMDVHSALGENFFTETEKLSPQVLPNKDNKGDAVVSATITSIDNLAPSEYELSYFEGTYRLIRRDDNTLIREFHDMPQDFSEEGFTLQLDKGSMENLDTFIIRPTRMGAKRIDVLTDDVNKIAAASPVRVEASIDNIGNGKIVMGKVLNTNTPSFTMQQGTMSPPFAIRFVDEEHFEILDNTGMPVPITRLALPEESKALEKKDGRHLLDEEKAGESFEMDDDYKRTGGIPAVETRIRYNQKTGINLFPSPNGVDPGFRVMITGEPVAGDTFRVEYNEDGTTDNQNIVALSMLQEEAVLEKGTSSFTDVYADLITRVGTKTHELEINKNAQKLLLNQIVAKRESISGVNMDEEAANLVRFQKLFQANAQIISVSQKMLDVLMAAFR